MYLEKMGLVKVEQEDEIFLTQMDSLIVSESESAQRVREHRARVKALQCNNNETESNGIETNCNTYTDTYIEKEADKDTDIDNPPLPPTGEEPKEAPKEESNEYDYNAHTNVENVKYVLNLGDYHEREYIRQNMKLYECIKDWMAYKDAKKPKTSNHYVNDKSIKTLLDKFVTNSKTYGVDAVIAVVNDAMSQCYQGIVWERTERIKPQSGSSLDNIDIGDDG
jgi:hypothetical protein